jgi:DNA polymerase-4
VTLIGLSLTNLRDTDAPQLALPLEETKTAALDAAMDGVRDRFGTAAITRAVLVGRDSGVVMPLLPD